MTRYTGDAPNTKINCKARVHTIQGAVVQKVGEHNHAGDAIKIASKKVVSEIKDQALNSRESPHNITSRILAEVPIEVAAGLPKQDELKRIVRRKRYSQVDYPALPRTRDNFEIPNKFKTTSRGENFLIFDSGVGDNRMLLFGTQQFIELMRENRNWYADGTFKKCPDIFMQIYSIHVIVKNKSIPVIYALLPYRNRITYEALFTKIKELVGGIDPQSIMLDFELAAVQAIETVFPDATIRLCFFHLCQSLYRFLGTEDLKTKYDNDIVFAMNCRKLCSLAYVPVDRVQEYFDELSNYLGQSPDVESYDIILNYFSRTYVSFRDVRQNLREGRFKIAYWNCIASLEENLPRTNNHQEGWHRSFNELIERNSPNIWKLLETLIAEQGKNEVVLYQFRAELWDGNSVPAKYVHLWERINRIVANFDTMGPLDFLAAMASNISL